MNKNAQHKMKGANHRLKPSTQRNTEQNKELKQNVSSKTKSSLKPPSGISTKTPRSRIATPGCKTPLDSAKTTKSASSNKTSRRSGIPQPASLSKAKEADEKTIYALNEQNKRKTAKSNSSRTKLKVCAYVTLDSTSRNTFYLEIRICNEHIFKYSV